MLGNNLAEILHLLQNENEAIVIPQDGIPEFDFKTQISSALDWVRASAGEYEGDIFPIEKVLKDLQVTVIPEEMDENSEISGYIEKRYTGWYIGVNKYEVKGRQRFTLAHELGHLLFHKKHLLSKGRFNDVIKLFRSEENLIHIEMQANSFAADLLMPSSRLREVWPNNSLQFIADNFGVSRYAAEYRARKLLLPEKKD